MSRTLAFALTAFAFQRAGAIASAAETDMVEMDAHGHRAYMNVTIGAVSAVASDSDMEELDTGDRPKGARRRAHERGLQEELIAEVSSKGCAELGGKWFSDPNGNMFQIEQKGCMIDFMLQVAKSPTKHRKRGVIRGTAVLIEPPFPEGKVLMNQTVTFGKDGDWVRKWWPSHDYLYVRDLHRTRYPIGGLLGDDDHTEAATPPEWCGHRLTL